MDRSALGLVEPILKHLLGGDVDVALYNRHYSNIVTCFIVAYGLGSLIAGRVIDRVGTKMGLALSITFWAAASIGHAFARTVMALALLASRLDWERQATFPQRSRPPLTGFRLRSARLPRDLQLRHQLRFAPWAAADSLRSSPLRMQRHSSPRRIQSAVAHVLAPVSLQRLQLKYGQSSVTSTQLQQAPAMATFGSLLKARGTWSFALSKAATDPVWWFYLYWLPNSSTSVFRST